MGLAQILGEVMSVDTEDDGALRVRHDGTLASLRTVSVGDGLEMLSLSQVLAWDLPVNAELRKQVAAQANKTMLGTVTIAERPGKRVDVILRYNFPVGGLDHRALQMLVLMVLAGGAGVRRALIG